MTLEGTNTYLIDAGNGSAAVIDPGPANERHIAAIETAATGRGLQIAAILVTHGHPDHAPGAAPLARRTGAPVYAHPVARFPHDRVLDEGAHLTLGKLQLRAIDAPGHAVEVAGGSAPAPSFRADLADAARRPVSMPRDDDSDHSARGAASRLRSRAGRSRGIR